MSGLVKRLRERAESERDIGRNNQAVWECLKTHLLAFEKNDGTHNAFALRLGLDHRNCAENDAKLAAEWDAAADRIEQLERELASEEEMHEECQKSLEGMARKWAAEKALADRLYETGTCSDDAWEAARATYRKARGL